MVDNSETPAEQGYDVVEKVPTEATIVDDQVRLGTEQLERLSLREPSGTPQPGGPKDHKKHKKHRRGSTSSSSSSSSSSSDSSNSSSSDSDSTSSSSDGITYYMQYKGKKTKLFKHKFPFFGPPKGKGHKHGHGGRDRPPNAVRNLLRILADFMGSEDLEVLLALVVSSTRTGITDTALDPLADEVALEAEVALAGAVEVCLMASITALSDVMAIISETKTTSLTRSATPLSILQVKSSLALRPNRTVTQSTRRRKDLHLLVARMPRPFITCPHPRLRTAIRDTVDTDLDTTPTVAMTTIITTTITDVLPITPTIRHNERNAMQNAALDTLSINMSAPSGNTIDTSGERKGTDTGWTNITERWLNTGRPDKRDELPLALLTLTLGSKSLCPNTSTTKATRSHSIEHSNQTSRTIPPITLISSSRGLWRKAPKEEASQGKLFLNGVLISVAMESHNPFPVVPTGYLIGSYFACMLYGLHLTQIYRYFSTYEESFFQRLRVVWVLLLSTGQMVIIMWTGWRYFSKGTENLMVWQEFLVPLSVQDGLVPLMGFTAQLFFGHRAWELTGRKTWFRVLVFIIPTITLGFGFGLAISARLWANDPWLSAAEWAEKTKVVGIPSEIVAIIWMALSAFTDGAITFILIYKFRSHSSRSPRLAARLVALTLETVLLTHLCEAVLCIIYLTSPIAHRTRSNMFWILLEVTNELYALSILFTINSRRQLKEMTRSGEVSTSTGQGESMCVDFGVSGVERRVEGYQGDTPFGVQMSDVRVNLYSPENQAYGGIYSPEASSNGSNSQSSGSETKAGTPGLEMGFGQSDYAFLPSLMSRGASDSTNGGVIDLPKKGQ
ncbi:hypothetical protein BD324DRAFT_652500 [Kockovaella imperatae]|uniref:DUF6534 domain-containing protein n=1 Tax=Kockovaella imperatae TaxID=4999 RepID=A0A1Y1UCU7_9TREE|nr:hypothetical protein BD324DRAFT_652500 [Kockovaella imperatae]ORX35367.1 hypothetical protein BD324DRAFT_652500 [Kockovaella imperatae]